MSARRHDSDPVKHSPSISEDGDNDIVIEVTEDDARDHTKSLKDLNDEGDDRLEIVDTLGRAFYVVRTGLSSHSDVSAVCLRLSVREATVLSAAHAARALNHRREDRHGAARVSEEHCSTLVQQVLGTPDKFAQIIHE